MKKAYVLARTVCHTNLDSQIKGQLILRLIH